MCRGEPWWMTWTAKKWWVNNQNISQNAGFQWGKLWKIMENHGTWWKMMDHDGKSWKIMEHGCLTLLSTLFYFVIRENRWISVDFTKEVWLRNPWTLLGFFSKSSKDGIFQYQRPFYQRHIEKWLFYHGKIMWENLAVFFLTWYKKVWDFHVPRNQELILAKNMVIFLHFINSNQTLKTSRNGANSWGEWWVFGL